MSNQRVERVAVEIQRLVTQILREEINDPRVQQVNLTDTQVTGDLSQATLYYSLLSDLASDAKKAQKGLDKAKGLIRHGLAQRMTMYKVPELIFKKDESVAYGNKIDELLRKLNQN
ncbi:MAG: 30S ribosome-binding factor RbfA [Streptococcaceae bacterium]|jgi:ribosome-binding factor A|nr:30S ribosome-binding factor RbfA [Streptococcaceae bacterium]